MAGNPEASSISRNESTRPSTLRRLPLACVAGALLAAGFPPLHWPVLLPAGFAVLVRALRIVSPKQGAILGLAAGLVFYAVTLPWLFNLFGTAAITLIVIAAAFPMLFGALYASVRRSRPAIPSWFAAALLWTGIEYFRSEIFWLRFGWMGLGYAPIDYVFFGATASLAGSYGISFLIAAMGAAMADSPLPKRAHRLFAASLAFVWLVPFAAQFVAPVPAAQPNNPMSVRLVQARAGEVTEAIRLSHSRNPVPVDVILWPEYSLTDDPTKNPKEWSSIVEVAKSSQAHLIFGATEVIDADKNTYHNTARAISPAGDVIGKHYKNHTVHFMKDGVPGRDAAPIDSSLGKLGVGICFDMDYPDVARKLVQRGAEVLLVPNMDPAEWGDLQREQHSLMFQMRAAECGRWLARADVAGGTSVAAPNGQQVETIGTAEPKSMEVIIGRERMTTPYIQGGWVFGPMCMVAGAVLVIWGWPKGRPSSVL